MLTELLQPFGIDVISEVQVMALPPRADIILIRRTGANWTEQQRLLLADGLRDLVADHILIEVKIREGVTEGGLIQIVVYDYLYLTHSKTLTRTRLQSVILSAQTPQGDLLDRFGFKPVGSPGVYECKESPWCGKIRLIALNELADTPHNAPLKCFASRRSERRKAFETIKRTGLFRVSSGLSSFLVALWRLMMKDALNSPEMEGMTPDHVMALGKEWFEFMVETTSDEELFRLPKVEQLYRKGEVRGEARGVIKGEAKTLLRLLTKKFGPSLPTWVSPRVQSADVHILEIWTDRILDAQSLEEVFQHGPQD
jgi:hypothetical protein